MGSVSLRAFADVQRGRVDVETAPAGVLLVIATGDSYEVATGDGALTPMGGGFLLGAQSTYGRSRLAGAASGVQVDLPWSVAVRVFGPLLPDVSDRAAAVVDLPEGSRLVDRLDSAGAARSTELVTGWLRALAESRRAPAPVVSRALERIEAGVRGVRELAAELDCSRGHVHRLVRSATGLSPSVLIRITRLHRLLDAADARPGATVADDAARFGYADHSHLCHETRVLAGRTPTALLGL